jgi:3-carboxy-cis,cis-muconate cycloisomerase
MCLPQIVLGAASAATTAKALAAGITPIADAMAAALDSGLDMIHAEALSFALTETLPRPEAQAAVKRLCLEANESQTQLGALAAREFPDLDTKALFDPTRQLGHAPAEALRFAGKAAEVCGKE